MASLTPSISRKSAADTAAEERRRNSREGFASFNRSMASQADVQPEAGTVRKAFLSGLGGVTDAPTAKTIALARKADKLAALPVNARKACERFDEGTQVFMNVIYQRHQEIKDAIDFTDIEAGRVMDRTAEQAPDALGRVVS